jgi:hypothetical protein
MPLLSEEEDDGVGGSLVEIIKETQPLTSDPHYKSTVVDSEYQPSSLLLIHVDGSPWTVNFYSQLRGSSETPDGQQPNQNGVYNQYLLIKDMELRVTSALAYTQDENNEDIVVGTSSLYPTIIANEGDMFVADIGDGREGIFRVNQAVKQSFFKDACFEITYQFVGITSSEPELLEDLNEKVVKTDHFVKKHTNQGVASRLVASEIVSLETMKRYLEELPSHYIALFYSNQYRTFLMPGKPLPTYDHYVVDMMLKMFSVADNPLLAEVRLFNVDSFNIKNKNIYEMLIEMNFGLLPILTNKMWLVGAKNFHSWPHYGTIYHSGVDTVVYPKDMMPKSPTPCPGGMPMYTLDAPSLDTLFNFLALSGFGEVEGDADGLPDDPASLPPPPIIHNVTKDDYYVFSKAFYDKDRFRQSRLELMVTRVLERKVVNPAYIIEAAADWKNWGLLEKFYYTPILALLLMVGIKNL